MKPLTESPKRVSWWGEIFHLWGARLVKSGGPGRPPPAEALHRALSHGALSVMRGALLGVDQRGRMILWSIGVVVPLGKKVLGFPIDIKPISPLEMHAVQRWAFC